MTNRMCARHKIETNKILARNNIMTNRRCARNKIETNRILTRNNIMIQQNFC